MGNIENITSYLSRNALSFPDKPAMLHPERISFKDLDQEVDRYAAGLISHGITKGTHTVLLVSAGLEFFIICFALFRIGAVPILIDPGMGRKAMVRALAGSGATALIGVPKAQMLRLFYPGSFKSVRKWVNTGMTKIPGSISSRDLRLQIKLPGVQTKMRADETAAIFFTSGSTGPPKGVIYQAGMLEAMVKMLEQHFQYGPEDIDLCTFPLLGLFVTCLGSSLVVADMDPLKPAKLKPQKIINNLNDFECTQMFGSPMIIRRLNEYSIEHRVKLKSLRRVISAGAPVPIEIQNDFLKLTDNKAIVHAPYGATEALPVTDILSNDSIYQDRDNINYDNGICVGSPLPGLEVRIISISDKPISSWSDNLCQPTDVIGEIVVKGPHITQEYKNNPQANSLSKIHDEAGERQWHRMGDLGRLDRNGLLWFYGRKNHRVETDQGSLYTIPVEAIFNQHPMVKLSALVGIGTSSGEFQKPVIVVQPQESISRKEFSKLLVDLNLLADGNAMTKGLKHFIRHNNFPVDPRHNAKIFREKLAKWAERKIK